MHCGVRFLLCEAFNYTLPPLEIIHDLPIGFPINNIISLSLYITTPYSARPCLRALHSNPTALSRSVLFAEIAVHTYLKACQCLDALPRNPGAPVDPTQRSVGIEEGRTSFQ